MEEEKRKRKNLVNFRPVLFCAFGLAFGIFLYGKIKFGGLAPSDFLFLALFFVCALYPLGKRRTAALLLSVLLFAGAGALALHLYTSAFTSALPAGEYRLMGTVETVSVHKTYTVVILNDLSFDGEEESGKCRVILGNDECRPADILLLDAKVKAAELDDFKDDAYTQNNFAKNIRYTASVDKMEKIGRSKNPFLLLNAALYDSLHAHMGREEADLAFALLTGNSGCIDEEVSEIVRQGGVAHIFAVSGLHIGILYAAAYALFPFLKKYRFLPPLLLCLFYCGLCNFTVSSVRALIMCAVLGTTRSFGKKYDFLESISFAALITLLFLPQQWFAAGMRLSYGACLGLALLSPPLTYFFKRIKFPRFLAEYLSAALAVQIFTLPVMLESFGYVSALALLFNFFLLPVLPVLFLGTLLCAVLALVIPPAASFFLLFPEGMFSAFLYVLTVVDVTLLVTGFSLGAGSAVFFTGCAALSGRVRLSVKGKAVIAAALSVLLVFAAALQNVVFTGCRIDAFSREGDTVVLVRTSKESVLLIDGEISLGECEDFLHRTYGGTLNAVFVLSEDEVAGANVAAFLPAEKVCLFEECETGLSRAPLLFGQTFTAGSLSFRFETSFKLVMFAEGCAVEFDFEEGEALGADLFVGETEGAKRLNYSLRNGTIKTL